MPDPRPTETKAHFVKRYPKPKDSRDFIRVLAECRCDEKDMCTGWVWAMRETPEFLAEMGNPEPFVPGWETEVEEPTPEEVAQA